MLIDASKLTSYLKLVTVVRFAVPASVNSYRSELLKIRSKTNRGVSKLFSNVIVSPIILWTDIQALERTLGVIEDQLEDVKADRDEWRKQANQLLLSAPTARKKFLGIF